MRTIRGLDALGDSILARRNGYALIDQPPDRLSTEALAPRKESTIPDSRLVPALILLLAACEQAAQELDHADLAVDGLSEELKSLSARLHDLLARIS